MIKENDKLLGFRHGIKDCISVSLAGALFGFVYGVLAHSKGLSFSETMSMSILVYAGAAQMVSLGIWHTQNLQIFFLAATAFIVCLRFLLMSAALRPRFAGIPSTKVYPLLFILIDENWAMTMLQAQKHQRSNYYLYFYFFGAGILFYFSWLLFGALGHHFASYIVEPKKYGFDFAFPAIFLALLVGLWRGKRDFVPWTSAGLTAIAIAYFFSGNWYIICGALVGSFVGVWRDYH